jgi:hypothetical protein
VKLRASTKIAIGAVVVIVAVPLGYKLVTDRMILGQKFPEIAPGQATLLGIDPGSGYHIIVANDVAALAEGGTDRLQPGDMSGGGSEPDTQRKLPIGPMLDVLQGNEKRLGEFIMSVNKLKAEEADLPLAAVWEAPDIEKAIAGDPKMKQKLETDLAMRLDGTPLDTVQDEKGILNGIVLRIPVPVRVMVAGKERRMVGTVIEPYRPRFTEELENRDFAEQQRLTLDTIKGYYRQAAEKVRSGALKKEDIAAALKAKISPARIQELASAPTEILSKAKIILNENFMESARVVSGAGDSEKPEFNLVMNLTDEGRRRLWQYSKLRKGSQLLFVVNGMAIAAPVVSAEIPQSDVTITNLPDGDIAKDAVETINRYAQGKGKAR